MILFVVPAYNEEKNIGALIEETHAYAVREGIEYRLIVVDDGSRDATAAIVREASGRYPCELISYAPNRGVGEAFRRGLYRALEICSERDVIVTKEADRTSDLGILKALTEKIRHDDQDVALASCYAKGGGVEGTTAYRRLLSHCANALIFMAFHIRGVHTYSSFYRAYRPSALRAVVARYGDLYEEPGFACVIELLVRLSRVRARIVEVPMVLRGSMRRGESKMRVGKTIAGYLSVMARNAFR